MQPLSEVGGPPDRGDSEGELSSALAAFDLAAERGEEPEIARFCAAFPGLGEPLAEALTLAAGLRSGLQERAASPLDRLGRYRLLGEVGRGGCAVVFRAHDERLGRDVALKVLRSGSPLGSTSRERFEREARALAQLDHPHVVPIYEVGEAGPFVYLSMPLMEGSLEERLPPPDAIPSALEIDRVLGWIIQAAEALAAAHAQGILHRDIKPANLLVDAKGELWVSDFGLALLPDDARLTRTGQALGTPLYVAPEQARGEQGGAAGDVFGLGATAFACLFGEAPRLGRLDRVAQTPKGRAVSPKLWGLLRRCLALDPDARYADASALLEALGELREPSASERRSPHLGVKKTLAGVALSLAALGALYGLTELRVGGAAPGERGGGGALERGGAGDSRASPPRSLGLWEPAGELRRGGGGFLVFKGDREEFERSPAAKAIRWRGRSWRELSAGARGVREVSLGAGARGLVATLEMFDMEDVVELSPPSGEVLARFRLDPALFDPRVSWSLAPEPLDIDGDGLPEVRLLGGDEVAVLKWSLEVWGEPDKRWELQSSGRFGFGSPTRVELTGGEAEILVGDLARPLNKGAGGGRAGIYLVEEASGQVSQSWGLLGDIRSTPQIPAVGGRPAVAYLDAEAPAALYRLSLEGGPPREVALPFAASRLTWPVFVDADGDDTLEVVIGGDHGDVVCLDPDDRHRILWRYSLGGPLKAYPILSEQDGDARPEVCLAPFGRLVCLNVDAELGARRGARVAWASSVALEADFVPRPTLVGDLDGDGLDELAVAATSGRVHLFGRGAPGGLFNILEPPAEVIPAGRFRAEAVFAAQLALLPSQEGAPALLVGATLSGWLVAWDYAGAGAVAWTVDVDATMVASPRVTSLTRDDKPPFGVLAATYDGWMLLVAPPEGARPAHLAWSFRAAAGIGSTPALNTVSAGVEVVFTDHRGGLYKTLIPR